MSSSKHNYNISYERCQVPIAECPITDARVVVNWKVMDKVSDFVTRTLSDRNWSMRELARQAKLSVTTISDVLSDKQQPSADFCIKVAQALDIYPRDRLLRLAGHLPPLPPAVAEEDEILFLIRKLPIEDRRTVLRALSGLVTEATPPLTTPGPARSKEEERIIPAQPPRRGDVVSNLEPGDPIREMFESYVSIPRTPEELHQRLAVLLQLVLDELEKFNQSAQDDESPRPIRNANALPGYSRRTAVPSTYECD